MGSIVKRLKSPLCSLAVVLIALQWSANADASVFRKNQTSPWHLKQELELAYEYERNFNLYDQDNENEGVFEPTLALGFGYAPSELFQAFFKLELAKDYGINGAAAKNKSTQLELTELYLLSEGIAMPGGGELALQIGRQRFDDTRQWLYDEQLDGVRLFYEVDNWHTAISVTRERNKEILRHRNKKETDNYMISTEREYDDHLLGGYIIKRQQRRGGDERPLFLGVQANGELAGNGQYWLELARVEGMDREDEIRGWGFDVGGSYTFEYPLNPTLIMGYAFGSGDTGADDGVNRGFRQTGLQDNEQDFGGPFDLRYHGVLLEPELSNIKVLTLGAGVHPEKRVSSYLLYHTYHQHRASADLRDTNLDTDPNGIHRELGSEIDWVLGADLTDALEAEFVLGYFMPGDAFDEASGNAVFFGLEIDYTF